MWSCLADLRRCLGPDAGRLGSPTPHTLCLDLAAAEVDVLAFDAAVARGDPSSLAEAVALYRGPLLEECAEPWALQERQAREQADLAARERLAALALDAGAAAEAERHLRRAVAVDPLRESTQRAPGTRLRVDRRWRRAEAMQRRWKSTGSSGSGCTGRSTLSRIRRRRPCSSNSGWRRGPEAAGRGIARRLDQKAAGPMPVLRTRRV